MTRYSRVKVLRFEGYGAEKKCEQAINQGIEKGWQPIDVNSYVPPDSRNLKVIAFMGKLDEEKADETEEEERTEEEMIEEEKMSGQEDTEDEKETIEEEGKEKIRECPRCENEALEIKDDHSAYCDFCGYLIDDIREMGEDRAAEEEESTDKQVF